MYKSLSIGSTASIYTSTHLRCMNRRKCEITIVQLGLGNPAVDVPENPCLQNPLGDCHTIPQIFLYDSKETPQNCVPMINALPSFSSLRQIMIIFSKYMINTNSSISFIKKLNPTTAEDKRLKIRIYLRRWS